MGMTAEQAQQLQDLHDAIMPSSNKRKIVYLGTGKSYSVTSYEGYKNFTVDNFLIEVVQIYTSGSASDNLRGNLSMPARTTNISKSYNPSNGSFSVSTGHSNSAVNTSGNLGFSMNVSADINIRVYLII